MTRAHASAVLVVQRGGGTPQSVPIRGRIVVGRECAGLDDAYRLVLDDPVVSREHLEIRLGLSGDRAVAVDLSTNGTRLNGARMERAVAVGIRSGDELVVGTTTLRFVGEHFDAENPPESPSTIREIRTTRMVLVVGDIVGFSTIAERSPNDLVIGTLEPLYARLRLVLRQYAGVLSAYVGDAVFAVWEADPLADAATRALRFALDANRTVDELAPHLPLTGADGEPIRMGWGAVLGMVAVTTLPGDQVTVIGDAANVAFRLSGLAARDGAPAILASSELIEALTEPLPSRTWPSLTVKGRSAPVMVAGLG